MTIKPDSHYQVLEIEVGASQADIKQAYRDLAKVWHPDRFSGDSTLQQKAQEKIKSINAAYEFLKSYQHQVIENKTELKQEIPVQILVNCEKLEKLLELGKLQEADLETKRLLLKLAGREQEGWLLSGDAKNISPQALLAIDRLWVKYSNGRFGFSVQSKIWRTLGCKSSNDMHIQTISENTFGKSVNWRVGSRWISQWNSFNYDSQSPQGSLPRQYIFALNGYWSFSQGLTGYFLLNFDEIILKFRNSGEIKNL
jgi:GUN4-like/DnaJ domain